jgi:hypothetical protein
MIDEQVHRDFAQKRCFVGRLNRYNTQGGRLFAKDYA